MFRFTAEALAIGKTLGAKLFYLKGSSESSTMNNTSHITYRLKDKIERLESQGKKKSNFTGFLDTAELKLMRGPTRRQSKQSKKVEIGKVVPVLN
jgi:hypothetical protein